MKIGWIGLGAMGTPMAARLCDANLEVSVYNRTESKAAPLKEKGVAVYTNPIDLAAKVDLVFTMLSDKVAIDAVLVPEFWEQMSEKIVVNMSTIAPLESLSLEKTAQKHQVTYLEAPVSGSVGAAKAGALLILVAGDEEVITQLKPVLAHFYLARKGVTYDSDYIKKVMHEVKKRDYDTNSRFAQIIKNFQENDFKLNSERSLFDWASKQTYIQMANMMMAAAMLGIDSCPIEGYDQEKVEAYLEGKGYLNTAEFGVSVMASFGYRNQEITPKTRWKTEVIYEVIE
ncbi:hypothetical protein HpNP15_15130 [Helicobacter pylori]